MVSRVPPSWREDLQAAAPSVDPARAAWLGNLNASHPWRTIVGDIRLGDGRRVVLKYQTDMQRLRREWAAARLLETPGAPRIAPACLGADEARKVLVFERITGPELIVALDGAGARLAWLEATRAVAHLHCWATDLTALWLELCPEDETSNRFAVYDLPHEELVAPFVQAGLSEACASSAVGAARQAVAEPGRWLCFTHSDLQTRHFFCTEAGPRIVDWEFAGLRHRLYDLACLIAKPVRHGRRVPRWAVEAAIAEYTRVCSLDPEEVRGELALVLAYELLIGVAEYYREEAGPADTRACLEGLLALVSQASTLAPLGEPAAVLLESFPGDDLPFCAGLAGGEISLQES
jgi:hypothetical protein